MGTSAPRRRRLLVVGPAGSGKTRILLRRALPWIRRDQEDRFPKRAMAPVRGDLDGRALLVVPTYGQALHLRRLLLLEFEDRPGFFETPILTFSGLAERIVDHPLRRMLAPAEKDLILRHVLRTAPPGFARVARFPGFRAACLEVIKEVKENGRPPEEAAEAIRARGEAGGADVRERLAALADVLLRYQAILDEKGLLDHEDLLVQLRGRLADDRGLLGHLESLAVDGFTDFTRVERDVLHLLAGRARRTWVSLTVGSGEPREDAFHAARETLERLEARGFRVRRLAAPRRFARAGLAAVEAGLFRPGTGEETNADGLEIHVGTDVEDEADRIARRVATLVREESVRPHEVGVVVRSFEGYRDLLPEAFARHGLPLLVHAARPLAREPALKGFLAFLRVVGQGWSGAAVRDLLLARALAPGGAGPDEADAFLRMRSGIRLPEGRDAWLEAADRPSAIRESLAAVAAEEDALRAAPDARARADRLRDAWGRLLLDEEPDGSPAATERALRAAEARRALLGVLDGVVRALEAVGEDEGDPADLLRAVREAVEATDVRTRSRRFETVHAISVEEARQWELPVVVVAGLLEGVFPFRPREDVFLRDREREALNRDGRLSLKEKLRTGDEERTLFYVAATRARDRLILTRPAADRDGGPLLPSFFLRDLRRVFAEGALEERAGSRVEIATSPAETTGRSDLRRRTLLGLAEPFVEGGASEREVRRASALHDRLLEDDPPYRESLSVGLRYRGTPAAALHDPEILQRVARRRSAFSATGLAAYAWCPYLDHAERTLRLKRPSSRGVERLDLGHIAHAALRAALGDGADAGEAFDAAVAETLAGREIDLASRRSLRDLRAKVVALTASERERLAASGLRPLTLERSFDDDGVTFGGVPVRGRIDRIDVAADGTAAVLDYKLKAKESTKILLRAIEEGHEFQLPLYLVAVREALGLEAAAAVLLPIEQGKPRGFVRAGAGGRALAAWRTVFDLSADDVERMVEETGERVAAIAARVHGGEIAIEPRETKRCERGRCPYLDLCRVEPWVIEAQRAGGAS